jgi:hypothetical protein
LKVVLVVVPVKVVESGVSGGAIENLKVVGFAVEVVAWVESG